MFDEIEQIALAHGLTMTCYVDDMALSGPRANKAALFEVRKIIARYGSNPIKHTYLPRRSRKF